MGKAGGAEPGGAEPVRSAVPATLELPAEAHGQRLDQAVWARARADGVVASRVEVRRGLAAGAIRVDGRSAPPGRRAAGGEQIDLSSFRPRSAWRLAPRPDLLAESPVVDQTPDWVALAKAPGLPTLPGRDPDGPSLLHAAIAFDPAVAEAGPAGEGGAVHRLDNATSGVVLFARTSEARRRLRAAFSEHAVPKVYEALVRDPGEQAGLPALLRGAIETTGGPRVRVRLESGDGPGPTSEVQILERAGGVARLGVRTRWGQRHQVRAHLAAAGWPILGDPLYAPPADAAAFERLGLHAVSIEVDGRTVEAPSGWAGLSKWR